jgi:aldehyde dehydrogenase (NAD+)
MKSMLEKYDLTTEQAGAGSGKNLACSGDILQSISPIDLKPIGKIRCASKSDYERITSRATQAFQTWKRVPAPKRGEIVRQIGERLRDHKNSLADIISLEVGKIRAEAEGEVQEMIDMADSKR